MAANDGLRDYQLMAHVTAPHERYGRYAALGDNLREALIVSDVELKEVPNATPEITLAKASGDKCVRCWKYLPLGTDPEHPQLCASCAAIVREL